jgi:hypothetical protein
MLTNFLLKGLRTHGLHTKFPYLCSIKDLHMDLDYVDFLFMLKSTKDYASILSSNHLLIMPKASNQKIRH